VSSPQSISHSIRSEGSSEVKQQVTTSNEQKAEKTIDKKELESLTEHVNDFFKSTQTHLQFRVHEKSKEYYVEIRNSATNEVLKEIPDKKFLDMVQRMKELAGLIVDEKI